MTSNLTFYLMSTEMGAIKWALGCVNPISELPLVVGPECTQPKTQPYSPAMCIIWIQSNLSNWSPDIHIMTQVLASPILQCLTVKIDGAMYLFAQILQYKTFKLIWLYSRKWIMWLPPYDIHSRRKRILWLFCPGPRWDTMNNVTIILCHLFLWTTDVVTILPRSRGSHSIPFLLYYKLPHWSALSSQASSKRC